MSTVQSVIATGVEQTIEVEFVNVDGIIARHHINMIAEKDYDGEIKGALAIGRDITYYHKEITTNADNTNN